MICTERPVPRHFHFVIVTAERNTGKTRTHFLSFDALFIELTLPFLLKLPFSVTTCAGEAAWDFGDEPKGVSLAVSGRVRAVV